MSDTCVNKRVSKAFTLIELLVAVALLVLVILGISAVFSTSNRAIRASHASADTDASARAMLRQIANDVGHMDRDGFLVIRSQWGTFPSRCQLAFLAHGAFTNRTGGVDAQSTPYVGDVTSHAAHVWYGHALMPEDFPSARTDNTGASFAQNDTGQLMDAPMGGTDNNQSNNLAVVARHVFALLPADNPTDATRVTATGGTGVVPAHPDIARTGAAISVGGSELAATPGSGRTSVASLTPSQIMARIRYNKYNKIMIPAYDQFGLNKNPSGIFDPAEGGYIEPLAPTAPLGYLLVPPYDGSDYWYEGRYFCYRFRALRRPQDGTNSAGTRDVINGLYRMSTTMLKHCQSFVVDWTDGTTDSAGNLRWSGMPDVLGLVGSPQTGTPSVVHQDFYRQKDGRPPVWPPVDGFIQSYYTGYPYSDKNSTWPPLTDKSDELRTMTPYNNNNVQPNSPWDYYWRRNNAATHDIYTAIFSFDNRKSWPKALRVSITINMISAESPNLTNVITKPQRVYSQIMWLPQ